MVVGIFVIWEKKNFSADVLTVTGPRQLLLTEAGC